MSYTEYGRYKASSEACSEIDWSLNGAILRFTKMADEVEDRKRCFAVAAENLQRRNAYWTVPQWFVDNLLLCSDGVQPLAKARGRQMVDWLTNAASALRKVDPRQPHHVEVVYIHFDRASQILFNGDRSLTPGIVYQWCGTVEERAGLMDEVAA